MGHVERLHAGSSASMKDVQLHQRLQCDLKRDFSSPVRDGAISLEAAR
jgi:hypothetical protein